MPSHVIGIIASRAVFYALAVASIATAAACADDARTLLTPEVVAARSADGATFYGAARPMGKGVARAYVVMRDGAAQELGVELNAGALDGLPAGDHHGAPGEHGGAMYELALPREALAATPFRSVEVDWVPAGHQAPYDRPHLDFHFYTITEAERAAIDPADPRWAERAANFPAPAYVPQRYAALSTLLNVPAGAVAVPKMGMHWLDVASPELHGAPFTRTAFMGSWDGRVIFVEPMITLAHLQARVDETVPMPPAAAYAPAGRHPGAYRTYTLDAGKRYRVALTAFAAR